MQNDPSYLQKALAPVARWMAMQQGIKTASAMFLIVSILWLAAYILSKFVFLPPWFLPSFLILTIFIVLGGGLFHVLWKQDLAAAARLADQRLGLKERLSTVHELDQAQDQSEVASLLRRDAAQHLSKVVPSQLISIGLPRSSKWSLLFLSLTGATFFMPEFRYDKRLEKQKEKEMIQAQGERIELMARRVIEKPSLLSHKEAPEDLKKISETGKLLSGGSLTKNEALRELTKLTDDLKKREQALSNKEGSKPLDRETWRERESFSPEQMQALQNQINKLQEKLGKTPATEKQISKLAKALQQAKESAKNVSPGSPEGQALSDSLKQSLADAQSANLSQVAEELQKAIEALEGADVGQVVKNLDDAIMDLDQARQQLQQMEQLMKQAAKAGKDLAEQLERGQAKLAQQTLENLKRQVEQAPLNSEQKQQLAKELMKALGPAKDYGKLSEHLQQAMEQAQSGDQQACSQSLQQAKQELEKLAQQQGQQQQLAEMINELQRAGMMIATGQCEGKGQGEGMCLKPGLGDGGKPGMGVGTWPDQNGQPQFTATWDNSGINRPDMTPKGHTDRGDPLLPQGTQTMKLTGEMGSGGPMPGIRLQGIFIRGESTAKVEEAFSTGAQEAEEALTKESIPTAYQGTVKEYFDLK